VAEEQNTNAAPPEQPARGGIMGKVLLGVAIFAGSAAGSGVATWFMAPGIPAANHESSGEKNPEATPGEEGSKAQDVAEEIENWAAIALDPFVVNLADKDASRYLRIKVSLMVDDKHEVTELAENQAFQLKLRDVILQSLTRKTSQELQTEEGKNHLREELKGELAEFFKKPRLVEVMFTDFVIQL
jgi:flagellar FliL protein